MQGDGNGWRRGIGLRDSCRWHSFRMSPNSNTWNVFWMRPVQMGQNVVGRWQVPSGPQLMLGICRLSVLVLNETLLVPALTYDSETMLYKEKVRSRIRDG